MPKQIASIFLILAVVLQFQPSARASDSKPEIDWTQSCRKDYVEKMKNNNVNATIGQGISGLTASVYKVALALGASTGVGIAVAVAVPLVIEGTIFTINATNDIPYVDVLRAVTYARWLIGVEPQPKESKLIEYDGKDKKEIRRTKRLNRQIARGNKAIRRLIAKHGKSFEVLYNEASVNVKSEPKVFAEFLATIDSTKLLCDGTASGTEYPEEPKFVDLPGNDKKSMRKEKRINAKLDHKHFVAFKKWAKNRVATESEVIDYYSTLNQ